MATVRYRKKGRKIAGSRLPRKMKVPPRVFMGGVLVVFSLVGIWYAAGPAGALDMRHIEVEDAQILSSDAVRQAIAEHLSGTRFGISKSSLLFVRPKHVRQYLLEQFPRLKDVTVRHTIRPLGFHVTAQERTLAALWCIGRETEEGGITRTKECFVADRSGVLFDEAPQSEGSLVMSIVDITRDHASLGDTVFSEDELRALSEVRDILKNTAGVLVVRMIRAGAREFRAETAQRWSVVIDPSGDLAAQAAA